MKTFYFKLSSLFRLTLCISCIVLFNEHLFALQSQIKEQTLLFKEQGIEAGLLIPHRQLADEISSIQDSLGSGVCVFDFNNDDLVDVFLVGGSGQTRYYGKSAWWNRQVGHQLYNNVTQTPDNIKFENVTEQSNINTIDWGMGCTSGDLDNDGDEDLLITAIGRNRLYRNDSKGKFTDISEAAGLTETAWSTSASIADINNDGLKDIYIANYIHYKKGALTFEAGRGFKGLMPESFSPELFDAQANYLYVNKGNLVFEEQAESLGVSESTGRSLFATWHDINQDSRLDLFVLNDKGSASHIYLNTADGFILAPKNVSIENSLGYRSLMITDLNHDKRFDFLLSTSAGQGLVSLIAGDKSYLDRSWDLGLDTINTQHFSSWGMVAEDFNNDGFEDLFVNNGALFPDMDSHYQAQGQGKLLFLGKERSSHFGDVFFERLENHYLDGVLSGRGLVTADFDNDGDLDVIATHNNNRPHLYTNIIQVQTQGENHHWLSLKLIDENKNSRIIGAVISLEFDDGEVLTKSTSAQQSFLSQGDSRIHFGIGQQKRISKLIVLWPDGKKDSFNQPPTDTFIAVKKGGKLTVTKPALSENVLKVDISFIADTYLLHKESFNKLLKSVELTSRDVNALLKLQGELTKPDIEVLFQSIKHNPSPELLRVMKPALNSESISIQLSAIDWIQSAEIEDSIYWIIDLLQDSNERIVCQAANVLTHFFKEEEATLHRERIAIPYLIKSLDRSDDIKLCILPALAESESFRAVNPVVNLLEHSNIQVRLAAIKTLGLLRQKHATALLNKRLSNQNLLGEEKAEIMIAYHRIESRFPYRLDVNLFLESGKGDLFDVLNWTSFMKGLLSDKEKQTFIREKILIDIFYQRINQKKYRLLLEDFPKEHIASITEVFLGTKDLRFVDLVSIIERSKQIEIRELYYRALISEQTKFPSKTKEAILQNAVFDSSVDIQALVLNYYKDSKSLLSDEVIIKLIAKSEWHVMLPEVLRQQSLKSHGSDLIKLLTEALKASSNTTQLESLLSLCAQSSVLNFNSRQFWDKGSDKVLMSACLARNNFEGIEEVELRRFYEKVFSEKQYSEILINSFQYMEPLTVVKLSHSLFQEKSLYKKEIAQLFYSLLVTDQLKRNAFFEKLIVSSDVESQLFYYRYVFENLLKLKKEDEGNDFYLPDTYQKQMNKLLSDTSIDKEKRLPLVELFIYFGIGDMNSHYKHLLALTQP